MKSVPRQMIKNRFKVLGKALPHNGSDGEMASSADDRAGAGPYQARTISVPNMTIRFTCYMVHTTAQ